MKSISSLHSFSSAKQLAFTALFSAFCLLGTLVIVIPLPSAGYFNTGDVFVLLAAWFLGPFYGSFAAAIGSALADIVSGFAFYAPATFIIKGLDAFIAYVVWAFCKKAIKKESLDFLRRALSAVFAELFMVLGYVLFESLLYGFGVAIASVLGNILQGICCGILAVALVVSVGALKKMRQYFPHLG